MGAGLLQPSHLIIVLIVVLIVFGPGKLPQVGSALGKGIRDFRGGLHDSSTDDEPAGTTAAATMVAPPVAQPAVSAPATPVAPTCAACSGELLVGARFCPNCGAAVQA